MLVRRVALARQRSNPGPPPGRPVGAASKQAGRLDPPSDESGHGTVRNSRATVPRRLRAGWWKRGVMGQREGPRFAARVAIALVVAAAVPGSASIAAAAQPVTILYDTFDKPDGYSLEDYAEKWSNPYGLGEMSLNDTRDFRTGRFSLNATPFKTGADLSVFDHIKYLAISNSSFSVPAKGSVEFSAQIQAETPGTQPGRIVHGTYAQSGAPYAAQVLEGQQAGATLHMIDFDTGQLFDWFVSGHTAFTLIERLPASVTGSPNGGDRETMYTQIIDEVPLSPGPHTVSIRYTRQPEKSVAEYFLDGRRVSKVDNVGIPLDVQKVKYTGIYPSLGEGEDLRDEVNAVAIGHGLFSLLDAFPFQHPGSPELAVSIPLSERLFGQGASARFDNITVTTMDQS